MNNKIIKSKNSKTTILHKIKPEDGNAELVLQKYEYRDYDPVYEVLIKTDEVETLGTFENENKARIYFWEKYDGFLKDYDGWMYQ